MKRHTDKYIPRPETVGALNAVLAASNNQEGGWNGAAKLMRIDFMKRCIRLGLVAPDCVERAHRTCINLEGQI